jgi:hypothetical protein
LYNRLFHKVRSDLTTWLLDVTTRSLEHLCEYEAINAGYAILSHAREEEEVSHQDIKTLEAAQQKRGYQKIDYLCQQAVDDDLRYACIDTCCIDKTSSAELSEAINSMFRWQRGARICYAYLPDVAPYLSHSLKSYNYLTDADDQTVDFARSQLAPSKWFTRGWPLQEMIAPTEVNYFGEGWHFIGTRRALGEVLETITQAPAICRQLRSSISAGGQIDFGNPVQYGCFEAQPIIILL